MNKIERLKPLAGYEEDFARWSAEQAVLLRTSRLDGVDWDNVAEEIESLGRSDRKEIRNRLEVLLRHLLKWHYQPAKRKAGWRLTIREQRRGIVLLIRESPSLKSYPASILAEEYAAARLNAVDEAGLEIAAIPVACPFSIEQTLDEDFFPDAP